MGSYVIEGSNYILSGNKAGYNIRYGRSKKMATNNRTLGVQNDTHAYSSSNSNISILIAINKSGIIVKSGVVSKQAAYIGKNSDHACGQYNNNESDKT